MIKKLASSISLAANLKNRWKKVMHGFPRRKGKLRTRLVQDVVRDLRIMRKGGDKYINLETSREGGGRGSHKTRATPSKAVLC